MLYKSSLRKDQCTGQETVSCKITSSSAVNYSSLCCTATQDKTWSGILNCPGLSGDREASWKTGMTNYTAAVNTEVRYKVAEKCVCHLGLNQW